jgi:palmitoyl transferase
MTSQWYSPDSAISAIDHPPARLEKELDMTSTPPVARAVRLVLTAVLLGGCAAAQAACEGAGWNWLTDACNHGARAFKEGNWDLYLTGHIHHGRGTYDDEHLRDLNEDAWGGGLGRSVVDARDNTHSVYFLAFKDSHFKPEYAAGYAWQARWPLGENWRAGVGVTAFVTLRSDYAHYLAPVPVILPLASLQYRGASLQASYVPRLSSKGGNGDVLFVFGRYSFD